MPSSPTLTLNDGTAIPQFGFGVWQVPDDVATEAVGHALAAGYRSIDTAAIYRNEEGVGRALHRTDIPRGEIFVTTKLWNDDQGYDSGLKALETSLKKLQLDYVDLYLMHWPVPSKGKFVDSWKAMIRLKEQGLARAIGVSNFNPDHLERIIGETGVAPAVNQVELHPDFQQKTLRAEHARHDIATESWSPLGQGRLVQHPVLKQIADKYGKTPAQAILRWHIDNRLIVIPKSVHAERIAENIDIFDFQLDAEDLAKIDALDDAAARIGPDPAHFG